MTPINFEGTNVTMKGNGNGIGDLRARRDVEDETGYPFFEEAWKPSEEELSVLNAGGHVRVRIIGTGLPPIAVFTGLFQTEAES